MCKQVDLLQWRSPTNQGHNVYGIHVISNLTGNNSHQLEITPSDPPLCRLQLCRTSQARPGAWRRPAPQSPCSPRAAVAAATLEALCRPGSSCREVWIWEESRTCMFLLKGGREDPLLLKGGRSGHASFVGFNPLKKIVSLRMGEPTSAAAAAPVPVGTCRHA